MKKTSVRKAALVVLPVLFLLAPGLHASVESDVKSYLDENKPTSLSDYPGVFTDVYGKHAPKIKESTQVSILYYFTVAENPQIDDVITLTNQAVTSAIVKADQEKATADQAGEEGEDRRGFYITDAVCGSFRGALASAYKQTTAAWKAVTPQPDIR